MTPTKTPFILILLVVNCHCFFWKNPYGQTYPKVQISHRIKGSNSRNSNSNTKRYIAFVHHPVTRLLWHFCVLEFQRSQLPFADGKLSFRLALDKAIKGLKTRRMGHVMKESKDIVNDLMKTNNQLYLSVRSLRRSMDQLV